MCELPKRPEQHIIDERGVVLLRTILEPKNYIFRNLGGRDYGIDGILEIAENGAVTGRMMSIQLKSSENFPDFCTVNHDMNIGISATEAKVGVIEGFISIPIKKTTCNYWLQNTMPVILVLADVRNNCLYYTYVDEQIRSRYREYIECDTFRFDVPANSRILRRDHNTIESGEGISNAYRNMIFKRKREIIGRIATAIN